MAKNSSKWNNVRVGDWNRNVRREEPSVDKFKNWADKFLNSDMLRDYDAYLWGAFPERRTKDVDILLSKGQGEILKPSEMEELSMANLDESLVNNNFLIDLGFTSEPIMPFSDYINHRVRTGESTPTSGNVFGEQWWVDDRLWKDRSKGLKMSNGNQGTSEPLGNNMVKMNGELPYPKMVNRMENNPQEFTNVYSGKPFQIKRSGEKYS